MSQDYILIYGDKKPEDNIILPFMFEYKIQIGLGWIKKDQDQIVEQMELMIQEGIRQFIFWGLEIGWDMVIQRIKERHSNISIKVICNTSDALLYYDYERENFFRLLSLTKQKVIDQIGFLKKGTYEVYQSLGYPCSYILEQMDLDRSKMQIKQKEQKEILSIGVYPLNDTWDKNIFNQLSVGKLMDHAMIYYNLLNNRMKDFLDTMKIASQAQSFEKWDAYTMADIIGQNDVNVSCNFTDYIHPIPLISMEMGVPCIMGNNSDLFSKELQEYLVVDSEDNPLRIKEKIENSIKNKEKIMKLYQEWKQEYNIQAKQSIQEFIAK